MAYYRRCPLCGDRLDPGEACECRNKEERKRRFWEEQLKVSRRDGQASFKFTERAKVV